MTDLDIIDRLEGCKIIGYKRDKATGYPQLVLWYGGYSFNVYNHEFNEINHFTNGEMAGMTSQSDREIKAKEVMQERGYEVIG